MVLTCNIRTRLLEIRRTLDVRVPAYLNHGAGTQINSTFLIGTADQLVARDQSKPHKAHVQKTCRTSNCVRQRLGGSQLPVHSIQIVWILQLTVAISLINTYLIIKHSFHATEKPQFSSYLYLFAGLESILSTRSEHTSARPTD